MPVAENKEKKTQIRNSRLLFITTYSFQAIQTNKPILITTVLAYVIKTLKRYITIY